MSPYELLVLIHVLAATTWVGGAITLNVLALRMVRSGDAGRILDFTKTQESLGPRLYAPASLAVLGVGSWMVAVNEAWTIGQLWIVLALVGFALTFLTGIFYFGPEGTRIANAVQARGAEDPDAQRRIRRMLTVSRLDTLLLVLIVADMVIKPGL